MRIFTLRAISSWLNGVDALKGLSAINRSFSTSLVRNQLTNHRLFSQVDWEKVESGSYAVVDPFNPSHILYLSEADYIVQVRVSQTNNKTLKVLATPDDTRPSDPGAPSSSQNSPSRLEFISKLLLGNQSLLSRKREKTAAHLFSSGFQHWLKVVEGRKESMVCLANRNVAACITRWHDLLSWWSRGSTMSTVVRIERAAFALKIQRLHRYNGVQFCILYLKGCLFIINSFFSGKKLTRDEIPSKVWIGVTNGLPSILPVYVRHGLRVGNKHFIHIWTSVCNMYKGIAGKYGPVDISTIIAPHPDTNTVFFTLYQAFARNVFWKAPILRSGSEPNLKIKSFFSTSKAGPGHPNSVLGAPRDAAIWFKPKEVTGISSNHVLDWLTLTGQDEVKKIFRRTAKKFNLIQEISDDILKDIKVPLPGHTLKQDKSFVSTFLGGSDRDQNRDEAPVLAKLAALEEPAGKIRVVAIVDYWTNLVLKPLHDWMFDLLSRIPTDATFDQEGRLKGFVDKGFTTVWSIDLSAATDTIPQFLYRALLEPMLGTEVTNKWLDLLVDRNFLHRFAPKTEREFVSPRPYDTCRYVRGQPMGALSSWSGMAMVHHSLVQLAAYSERMRFASDGMAVDWITTATPSELRYEWYTDYMVLGDDIVIASEQVAKEYIRLCKELGVVVGLSKSYISDVGFLNFASQSFVQQENVSPVSFREFIGTDSLSGRAEFALRLLRRGWSSMEGSAWLAPLMKYFVSEGHWNKIREDLAQGRSHPLVSWILSVLLVPGSRRFEFSGMPRASIYCYLSTMLKKAVIWNKPIDTLHKLSSPWDDWGHARTIAHAAVNSVYEGFLQDRKRLASFDTWFSMTLSIENKEVIFKVLKDQVAERLEKWAERYRRPLKTFQVLLDLPDLQPHMLEMGFTGKVSANLTDRMDTMVALVADASEALPRVPDYESLDAAVHELHAVRGGVEREAQAFVRLIGLFGSAEHLHSYATPGLDRTQAMWLRPPNPPKP